MALDYQKSMYSKCRIDAAQNASGKRTTYERMNGWQNVITADNDKIHVDDLMNRQNYPAHLNYSKSGGYDDNHKSYLRLQQDAGMRNGFPHYGPPRLRNGKTGGSWRHVTEVLQAGGSRRVFIDGKPGLADMTLVRGQEIPSANTIHKMAGPSTSLRNKQKPKQMGGHDLEAFKSTEHQNWLIMR